MTKIPVLATAILLAGSQLPAQTQGVVIPSKVDQLEIGGQLRLRFDQRDPVLATSESASGQLGRVRAHVKGAMGDNTNFMLQLQKGWSGLGSEAPASIHQAYMGMNDMFGVMNLKLGRFELQYGNQRMVSPLVWSNTGRAWDGALINHSLGDMNVDFFYTKTVQGQGAADGADDVFGGLYAQTKVGEMDLDLYALTRDTTAGLNDTTYGALLEGANSGVKWSAEYAMQTGDHGANDAGGSAMALRADYALQEGMTVGLGYEVATGVSGTDDRFIPVYNFGHAWQGHQDIVGWSNLNDLVFRGKYKVADAWNLHGDYHIFTKNEADDALYTGSGGSGATLAAGEDEIGNELDLYMKGALSDGVSAWIGVSSFSPGDAVANAEDQTWMFAHLVLNF
ncbi:MAG: alginate export family protein [Planctomycetota bacterium]|jgi:hypothetical protein|nr:alginate export family protein [Planctomycetota bacterium]